MTISDASFEFSRTPATDERADESGDAKGRTKGREAERRTAPSIVANATIEGAFH